MLTERVVAKVSTLRRFALCDSVARRRYMVGGLPTLKASLAAVNCIEP